LNHKRFKGFKMFSDGHLAKNDGYSDAPLSPPLMCSSKTGDRLFGTSTVRRSRFAAGCGQDWRIN
jgi:hypothetical protein